MRKRYRLPADVPTTCADHGRYVAGCENCRAASRMRNNLRRLGRTPGKVDGTGTARRLQALAVLGWSASAVAAEVGVSPRLVWQWRAGGGVVLASTDRRVREVYDRLSMRLPEPSRGVTRARRDARLAGWVPPLAWDESAIEDPSAAPVRTQSRTPSRLTDSVVGDEVARLAAAGSSDPEIAARVGLSARTVLRIRQREGVPSLRRSA